jgi:hypothetical protein
MSIFPHESLVGEPHVQTVAGAREAVRSLHLPHVKVGLEPRNVFGLLRDDVPSAPV